MGKGVAGLELLQLWPCVFLQQSLPDHEQPTLRLAELARERPLDDTFTIGDASVEWLKANVVYAVSAYLRAAGFTRPPACSLRARFDIQRFEDIRPLHNRTGAYLTGCYVVSTPEPDADLGARDDRRPGSFTFYDPRNGMNMNSIRRDPYLHYHYSVPLTPGLLLIWPAFVRYFEHPNHSREPAVRIAFDVQVNAGGGAA